MKKEYCFILFFFILALVNAQKKNSNLIQKKIESCRILINDSVSVYKIHENLKNDCVDIIIKTENSITSKCFNQNITNDIISALNQYQNPVIKLNDRLIDINITDFKNLIPNKISILRKKYKILIVELYNFSYSTVGNTYINLCFKIDKNGKVIDKKIIESKLQMKMNSYNKVF
ncbi:hypothetical protein [Flavobacterium sp. HTF]|uniref:hypothetical protein n=1 Tax=Flavobacterium sp. HTF TaxID=2170732 RepID=UPI000D5CD78F|nr:hypothetical protein [Flavobacterium sp. HTF]PWB22523.1 hypothetical protein DCO46_17070 [Flavobacterium sp. HTF]